MRLLAFDTSTNQGGVAVLEDDKVLSKRTWDREGSHGELLTPAIEFALNESGLALRDLDAIVVGHGPGSFTGVRIAVNAARTLAYSLAKPVYAFDTNDILAAAVSRTELPLLVIVNAHKNMMFTRRYENGVAQGTIDALTIEQIEALITTKHICIGDGFDEYAELMSPRLRALLVRKPGLSDLPDPVVVAKLSSKGQPLGWKDVQALYIRASGAEEKLEEKLREESRKRD